MKNVTELGGTVKADAKTRTLTITLPLHEPKQSATGKTLLVAGTNGAVETSVKVNAGGSDKTLILNVNAYVYAKDKASAGEAAAPVAGAGAE